MNISWYRLTTIKNKNLKNDFPPIGNVYKANFNPIQ